MEVARAQPPAALCLHACTEVDAMIKSKAPDESVATIRDRLQIVEKEMHNKASPGS